MEQDAQTTTEEHLMRLISKIALSTFTGLGLLALVGCAALTPSGKISVQAFANPETPKSHLKHNGQSGLELTAYVTGWVEAPADILIDQDEPSLPDELKTAQWVPSVAYVVEHPTLGAVIFDAGLRNGDCDYGLRPVYWVPCQNTAGSDLVSQLKHSGIRPEDIRYIIPSHFHGDHISGLEDLISFTDAPVLMTDETLAEIRSPFGFSKGIPASMLAADMRVQVIDPHWQKDSDLGESFDLFGDGSLKIFRTSGHTDSHISALIKTRTQPVLLTFDAAHLQANFDLSVPSGAVSSKKEATESLKKIKVLSESMPVPIVVFGHEPTQWACTTVSNTNVVGGKCVSSPILPD
jgi:glyoxylase-like metal-dependent hydrolase (beta-lactamase superfamily II)